MHDLSLMMDVGYIVIHNCWGYTHLYKNVFKSMPLILPELNADHGLTTWDRETVYTHTILDYLGNPK